MRSVQSTLFTLFAASSSAFADTTLNLTPGVSPISHDVYELHMTVFWICVAIGVLVFGVMAYAMIYHRKSKGAKPAHFHTHPILEITWTIVPALILVLMAIPATKVLFNMNNDAKEDITIVITGYQWKWHYEYKEDGLKFFSNLSTPYGQIHGTEAKTADYLREVDHPLVVPVHKKIRFLITSNDVNHAWWVPDLGVKRDAISGIFNEAWTIIDKPGTYRGQCAELCGVNHAFMPIVVIAMSEQGYKDWVAEQKGEGAAGAADVNKVWTLQELSAKGEETYNRICVACHQPGGVGSPPMYPALKGSKIATGPIADHVDIVFNGKSGTAMQAFKNQLSDTEIAGVITYERNAFGNNKGDLVQPAQIKALRDGKSMADALATKPSGVTTPAGTTPTPPAGGKEPPAAPASEPASAAAVPAAAASSETPAAVTPASSSKPVAGTPASATSAPAASAEASMPVTSVKPVPKAAEAASADDIKDAMTRGEKTYLSHCAACHQATGAGLPPTFPALKGSPIATGPVAAHIDRVMNGKQGTAMVPFKDQLSDQDLADVITYERNAWGNNTGTLVSPADIAAWRKQNAAQPATKN